MTDLYGALTDSDQIEQYVKGTLEEWLTTYLAAKERQRGLPPRKLREPADWTTVTELDPEALNKLPAIIIESGGTSRRERDGRTYRTTWPIAVIVVLHGTSEKEARYAAGMYLAAIKLALIRNPTLGQNVERCLWVGPDAHGYGALEENGSERAAYGTTFEVTVKDEISGYPIEPEPPEDPYGPFEAPENPNVAEITVSYLEDE